ncbi:MAG: non-hydrolyzing UDP-N-acetylglucosamine 2-epimerase [Vicinamibacterales bacterium]
MIRKRRVVTILGTRPEIIKLSPVLPLMDERFDHVIVHSGQHYSYELDRAFFEELALRAPDHALSVGSAPHGEQTARILSRFEPILTAEQPDAVLVQGDTNTTLGGGLCAAKLGIPVVHLEAGGRSFDRLMPEEMNRVVVDHVSSLMLAADAIAETHLQREGLPMDRVAVIGSTAIDAVIQQRHRLGQSSILHRLGLRPHDYVVVTVHRAANTLPEVLPGILDALGELAQTRRVVFPLHPRTLAAMRAQGLACSPGILVTEPLGYLDTLRLVQQADALLTDSGGLQEESAVLGTPTLIVRFETEWRYLTDAGVHKLIGNTRQSMAEGLSTWLRPEALQTIRTTPAPLVSGAAKRAVDEIEHFLA